jgi:thioesterase domain-containing protein
MSVTVPPDPAVLAAVQKAWMQALDAERCDFTQTWEQAGGDSLATLHLLLRLERAFGRKLTFDMMRAQMRASDLAAALLLPAAAAQRGTMPLVHLLPSLFGDEPRLSAFRQALDGRVRFDVVDTPDACQPATTLRDVPRMAALAARDIHARQPSGPILLAGYSFGGCVAFETARTLISAGRDVAWLGLLDAPFGNAAFGSTSRISQRMPPTRAIKYALALWVCSWDAARRAALALAKRLGLAAEIEANRLVFVVFREHATNRWVPAPLEVDTWLAVSAELAPTTLATWQRLCARLRVVHLPGDHMDIFHAPAAELIIPAFDDAVRTVHLRMPGAARTA